MSDINLFKKYAKRYIMFRVEHIGVFIVCRRSGNGLAAPPSKGK